MRQYHQNELSALAYGIPMSDALPMHSICDAIIPVCPTIYEYKWPRAYARLYTQIIYSPPQNLVYFSNSVSSPSISNSFITPLSSPRPGFATSRSPHIPPCPLKSFKCLNTASFASKKRSTQFCMHPSSAFSNFPDDILPVTHFVQQMSVRLCTAEKR